jgi:hypothetical protein
MAIFGLPRRRAAVGPEGGIVSFEARERLPDTTNRLKLLVGAAAVVVAGLIGLSLLDGGSTQTVSAASPAPSASSSPAASPSPVPTDRSGPSWPWGEVDPGRYSVWWWSEAPSGPPVAQIDLVVPAGWWTSVADWAGSWRKSIVRYTGERLDDPPYDSPTLTVHQRAVTQVKTDVCDPQGSLVPVGPTVDDLVAALQGMVGLRVHLSRAMLGAYPAWRVGLTLETGCPGPDERRIWEERRIGEERAPGFEILEGGYAAVYLVDVDGQRLVITTHYRDASAEEIAELGAIVASIDIQATSTGSTATRRGSMVGALPLSLAAPASWEGPKDGLYVSRSIIGPQGAEAMVMWAGYPDGGYADPCPYLRDPGIGPSAADLAAAVAAWPSGELVEGPSAVTVGGRDAQHVVVTVREDVGCGPGLFYAWEPRDGGAFWSEILPGDTIRVWIVEVAGTRLFIAGETHRDDRLTEADQAELEQEIQQIVDSVEFLTGP